jgi:hypothetical protein
MHRRHTPRRRGIQYAAASRFIMDVSGILDRPLSRTMTTGGLACSNASDTTPHSRDALRPRFAPTSLSKERAQGKPGARCTRSLACESDKAHEHSHHRFTGITRPSLRNGFNGLFRALPGDRALLPPSLAAQSSANLTPASGCQDHTTSPSALCRSSCDTSASTASRSQRS